MGYIIKNTSGLVNTRLTDTGRLKLSQGNFNISYFQIGDSEVSYNTLPSTYNQFETFVLEPSFNAQNSVGVPQSNKENVKYPYYVDGFTGNTYGIPFMDSIVSPVYNRAVMRGFFTGNTTAETINWSALTNNQYAVNSNYVIKMNQLIGSNKIELQYDECNGNSVRGPMVGDIITIFYDGRGLEDCNCSNLPTPTPTPTSTVTPTPSSTPTICWENGFVSYLNSDFIGIDNFVVSNFVNTGFIVNSKPYYSAYPFPIFIYWDGIEWVAFLFGEYESLSIIGVDSPLGNLSFGGEKDTLTGYTECGSSCNLCMTITFDKTSEIKSFYENIVSGTSIYVDVQGAPTGDIIVYSSDTESWVFYNLSTSEVYGILTGLTENDCPIGSFIPQSPSIIGLSTSSGFCDNLIAECSCLRVSAVTDVTNFYYLDCNQIVQNIPFLSAGTEFSGCILTYWAYETGEVIQLDCDPNLCSGVSQTNLSNFKSQDFKNIFKNFKPINLKIDKKSTSYKTEDPCASPTPTPTPSATFCPTPTPSKACPPPPPPDCVVDTRSCYPILTYRITDVCFNTITLDRPTPDFSFLQGPCYARTIIYPPSMVSFYDSYTPRPHWNDNVINFESVCYTDEFDVKIWNMNIPWSENPAGLNSAISKDYTQFGSIQYLGTKEYLGYASSSGQTDTDSVYYFNSFGDKIIVTPEEQKAIAIIHYTNQTVDFFYGEKFALEPFENVDDTTGQARNFKLHIPWLMWHKNPDCCHGQTFWVDPPGFDELDLFKVHYIQSKKNVDMNNPGIRYYHLWDDNANVNGIPNRVGKVFPDAKIIIIDDEELIAAMSYKSNRNWTLPAPRLSLITPNTCGNDNNSVVGILTGESETLYVTYRLTNTSIFTNSLHNNYYSVIQGPNLCLPLSSQNVGVRFGGEFNCLNQPFNPTTTTTTLNPTTTTTTFNPFTTTTTTEQICGDCYQLVRDGDDVSWSYVDCNGSTILINVGIQSGTPKFVCSPTEILPPFIKTYSIKLGDCTSLTDCTPCWMTGFTFQFTNIKGTQFIDFVPSGNYTNGYPIFTNQASVSNFYFDGSDWIWAALSPGFSPQNLFSGDTPLNTNFIFAFDQYTGSTYCGSETGICLSIFQSGIFKQGIDFFKTIDILTGDIIYFTYSGEFEIIWDGVNWVVKDSVSSLTVFTLTGLTENDIPIGNWSGGGLESAVSNSGSCDYNCNCFIFTGETNPTDVIEYMDCDGVLQEYFLSSGLTVNLCVKNNFYLVNETNVPLLDSCDPLCDLVVTLDSLTTTTTNYPYTTTTTTFCPPYCDVISGFYADKFEIIVQKVPTGDRPSSSEWKIIDFTDQLSNTTINGFITQEGLTGNTFVITQEAYDDAPYYNLNDYIDLTPVGFTGSQLNFGDEYYFYGSLETDIQATIYEMRYKINLGQSEFLSTSNPSWTNGNPSYVTEIGLYDSDKNLMIISKMQSPVLRQGIQQFLIKFDL